MLRDSSQPIRQDDELLNSVAALRALPEGVVLCDRGGTVRFINPAAARMLTIDPDRYLGRPALDIPGGIVLGCEDSDEYSLLVDTDDARLQAKVAPIWSETREKTRIGTLVALSPVSQEMKHLQDLTSVIGYELRSPLTSIIGYADLLLRGFVGPIDGPQHEVIQVIHSQSKRLNNIITHLQRITVLDSRRIELDINTTMIADVIAEVRHSLQTQLDEKKIALIAKLPDNLNVQLDDRKLQEILTYLVDNAIKYSSQSTVVELRAWVNDSDLRVDIQDTGIGITDEVKPRIFTRYCHDYANPLRDQIDHYSGIGLGLAIVKRLVELHSGRIWFESAVGQGSTFSFALPLAGGGTV